MKLLNALSLSMLTEQCCCLDVHELDVAAAKQLLTSSAPEGVESAVGHAPTAELFSVALGIPVQVNRVSVLLVPYEEVVVGQYVGPRLPEGATSLPEGATLKWYRVQLVPQGFPQDRLYS